MKIKDMSSYRLYILIALFTFVTGITITGLLIARRKQSSEPVYLVQVPASPDQVPLHFSWWYESRELGRHSEGYIASDGAKVARNCAGHSSVSRAQEIFQNKLKTATQIVERSPVSNDQGDEIGVRVVGLFRSPSDHAPEAIMIWTDEGTLCTITGPSLGHVLEFENWITGK